MNSFSLIGTILEHDLRYTPGGTPILDTTLAGKTNDRPWYQRTTIFGKLAEMIVDTPVGRVAHAYGHLRQDSWQSKEGEKRSKISCVATEFSVVDGQFDVDADGKGQVLLVNAVHEVRLAGFATGKAEVRNANEKRVASVSIALNRRWFSQKRQAWEEEVSFIPLSVWSDLPVAFDALASVEKGDRVTVHGALRNSSWEQDGQRKFRTEVMVHGVWIGARLDLRGGGGRSSRGLDIDESDAPF